ncbi:putative Holliday junction resolvase [Entomoplasma freundtii]|uniref:Putative pre-16S rRNA nuclease n=1 Tax=Entomoplasma freundtii TaxID=74700 RepID=A0A2K8NRN9_9MOLU|nr:Holliday junction resolvase RuvX [Entomoplasma freundtii]ATZ16206.1 Holliday junction DNA helicase [Entomoplasma freundtii]TDY56893.1 putative Holliday junction resolvase [Entomoplasma freundtii]
MTKYLGLDVGTKTIGLAWSGGTIVSPGETIRFPEEDYEKALEQLTIIIHKEKPTILVFGYPLNMDGTVSATADLVDYVIQGVRDYNPDLRDDQIVRVDERRTTQMAHAIFHEAGIKNKKHKAKKDSLAAQLILEQYLSMVKNKPQGDK